MAIEQDSRVFCLIEGPNSKACVDCHLESHGDTPCNIQEVEPGMVELVMGANLPVNEHHLTLNTDGEADPAYRIVMVAQTADGVLKNGNEDFRDSSNSAQNISIQTVRINNRRPIEFTTDQSLIAVFDSPINAIQCVKQVNQKLSSLSTQNNPVARYALYYGQPLSYQGSFFEMAIKHARILHKIAGPGQVVISNRLSNLIDQELDVAGKPLTFRMLNVIDEKFIIELFQSIDQNLSSEHLDVNFLTRNMGISRTQLYRKITRLTGKTPNQLITAIRIKKALSLIRNREGNMTFVSQEVGYANPSYFSRIFRETFGCAPSDI